MSLRIFNSVTDYEDPMPSRLVFDVGTTHTCVNITTVTDTVYEDDESFLVTLSSTRDGLDIFISTATVHITNDDGMKKINTSVDSYVVLFTSLHRCGSELEPERVHCY